MAVTLFDNSWETNATSAIGLIEQALVELGQDPELCELDDPSVLKSWWFSHGSATVTVALRRRPGTPHLRITTPVMTPAKASDRAALHSELLARNVELCGMAFGLDGDKVLMVSERSTLDLDRSEVVQLIGELAREADAVDDALVARYGGRLG
ncbi:MAG TPA: YbjN domain-containing protein [Kofleriaceae bacterium]|nr:YbjN domain-containing protein [Kofleriaceae bacterium]